MSDPISLKEAKDFCILAEIRCALGDNGRRMQPELLAYCHRLKRMEDFLKKSHDILRENRIDVECVEGEKMVDGINRLLTPTPEELGERGLF